MNVAEDQEVKGVPPGLTAEAIGKPTDTVKGVPAGLTAEYLPGTKPPKTAKAPDPNKTIMQADVKGVPPGVTAHPVEDLSTPRMEAFRNAADPRRGIYQSAIAEGYTPEQAKLRQNAYDDAIKQGMDPYRAVPYANEISVGAAPKVNVSEEQKQGVYNWALEQATNYKNGTQKTLQHHFLGENLLPGAEDESRFRQGLDPQEYARRYAEGYAYAKAQGWTESRAQEYASSDAVGQFASKVGAKLEPIWESAAGFVARHLGVDHPEERVVNPYFESDEQARQSQFRRYKEADWLDKSAVGWKKIAGSIDLGVANLAAGFTTAQSVGLIAAGEGPARLAEMGITLPELPVAGQRVVRTVSKLANAGFAAQMTQGSVESLARAGEAAREGDPGTAIQYAIEGLVNGAMAHGIVKHMEAENQVHSHLDQTSKAMFDGRRFSDLQPDEQAVAIHRAVQDDPYFQEAATASAKEAKRQAKRIAYRHDIAQKLSWKPDAMGRMVRSIEDNRIARDRATAKAAVERALEDSRQHYLKQLTGLLSDDVSERQAAEDEWRTAEAERRAAGREERPRRKAGKAEQKAVARGVQLAGADQTAAARNSVAEAKRSYGDIKAEQERIANESAPTRTAERETLDGGYIGYRATSFSGEYHHFGVAQTPDGGFGVFRQTPDGTQFLSKDGTFSEAPETPFSTHDKQTADVLSQVASLRVTQDSWIESQGSSPEREQEATLLRGIEEKMVDGQLDGEAARQQAGLPSERTEVQLTQAQRDIEAAQAGMLYGPLHGRTRAEAEDAAIEEALNVAGWSDAEREALLDQFPIMLRDQTENALHHIQSSGDYLVSKKGVRWTLDSKGVLHPDDDSAPIPLMKNGTYTAQALNLAQSGRVGFGMETRDERRVRAAKERDADRQIANLAETVADRLERAIFLAKQNEGLELLTGHGEVPGAPRKEGGRAISRPPREATMFSAEREMAAGRKDEAEAERAAKRATEEQWVNAMGDWIAENHATAWSTIEQIAKNSGMTPAKVLEYLHAKFNADDTPQSKIARLKPGDTISAKMRPPWVVEQRGRGLFLRSGNSGRIPINRFHPSADLLRIVRDGQVETAPGPRMTPEDVRNLVYKSWFATRQLESAEEVKARKSGKVKDPEPRSQEQAEARADAAAQREGDTKALAVDALSLATDPPRGTSLEEAEKNADAAEDAIKTAEAAAKQQVAAADKTVEPQPFPERAPITMGPGSIGEATTVKHLGEEYAAHYVLAPIKAVVGSHVWDGTTAVLNPEYNQELQPATISEDESGQMVLDAQVRESGGRGYDFDLFADRTVGPLTGPMVVEKGGRVVAGNRRFLRMLMHLKQIEMIEDPEMREAYREGFRSRMRQLADQTGIAVFPSDGQQYVVLRMLDDPIETRREAAHLGMLFNKNTSVEIREGAKGVALARMLSDQTLEDVGRMLDQHETLGEAIAASPQVFTDIVRNELRVAQSEEAGWFNDTKNGKVLSENGRRRFVSVLMGKALGDSSVLEAIQGTPAYTALERAVIHLTRLAATKHNYLVPKVVEATQAAAQTLRSRKEGESSHDDWEVTFQPKAMSFAGMEEDTPPMPDKVVETIWRAIFAGPRTLSDRIKAINATDRISVGGSLFDTDQAPLETPNELFNRVFRSEIAKVERFRKTKGGEGISDAEFEAALRNRTMSDAEEKDAKRQAAGEEHRRPETQALRRRIDQLTGEEKNKLLLTSRVTGLPNLIDFEEHNDPHLGGSPAPVVGFSDLAGLKAFNETYGHVAGDKLLHAAADAMREAGLEAYHRSGDEFLYRGSSEEDLKAKLDRAREILRNTPIEIEKDGKTITLKGADFTYGMGKDLVAAEDVQHRNKAEEVKSGQRGARGEFGGIKEASPKFGPPPEPKSVFETELVPEDYLDSDEWAYHERRMAAKKEAKKRFTKPFDADLYDALHSIDRSDDRWAVLRQRGATDAELLEAIKNEFGIGGASGSGGDSKGYEVRTDKFYHGFIGHDKKPTLQGKPLVNEVRRLMEIPQPGAEKSVDTADKTLAAAKQGKGYVTPEELLTFLKEHPSSDGHADAIFNVAQRMAEYVYDLDPPPDVERKDALAWALKDRVSDLESGSLEKRGSYTTEGQFGRGIIAMHKAADATTFIHEFAHAIFPLLSETDMKAIDSIQGPKGMARWSGARSELKGDVFNALSEKFAHGLEKFIRDENPTGSSDQVNPALKVLKKMKDVFVNVYRAMLKDPLSGFSLSEDARQLFADMFSISEFDAADDFRRDTEAARAAEKKKKGITRPDENGHHPLVETAKQMGADGITKSMTGNVLETVGDRVDPAKPTVTYTFKNIEKGATAWMDVDKSDIKGAELVEGDDGTYGIRFNVDKDPPKNVLYQDASMPKLQAGLELEKLQNQLKEATSPMMKRLLELRIEQLKSDVRLKYGVETPRPQAHPELAKAAIKEVKRETATPELRRVPDKPAGAERSKGITGVPQPPVMGMPRYAAPAVSAERPRGKVVLENVKPVDLIPQRPRGKPVGILHGDAFDEKAWKDGLKRAGLPENLPPPTVGLSPETAKVLKFAGQKQIVQTVLSALEQGDGAVIASATGSGKSFTELAVAKETLNDNPDAKILVITKNRKLLKDLAKIANEHYGMKLEREAPETLDKNLYGATYARLRTNPIYIQSDWDLVISDESGEARNWHADVNQQGKNLMAVMDKAKKGVYVSATPFHSPNEYGYLEKLNLWKKGEFPNWIRDNFAHEKVGDKIIARLDPGKQAKFRQQLIERGQFVSQEIPYDGFTAHFGVVPVTEETRRKLDRIAQGIQVAKRELLKANKKGLAERIAAFEATYTKAYLERSRLPEAIQLVKRARAQGWQVAVFSETTSEDLFRRPLGPQDEAGTYRKLDEESGGLVSRIMPPFPNVVEELRREFGKDLGDYSGVGNTDAERDADLQRFISGELPMLYTSYAAGGIGLSLHDTAGDKPRLSVFLGPPYSGVLLEQAMGRLWRFGVKSDTRAVFLATDSEPDIRLMATKVGPRMRALRASVLGERDSLASVMSTYSDEEKMREQQDILAYDQGNEVKVDAQGFTVRSKRKVGFDNWSAITFPKAEEAMHRGMNVEEAGAGREGDDWTTLYQDSHRPWQPPQEPKFGERRRVKQTVNRVADFIANGSAPGVQNLDPGTRREVAAGSAAVGQTAAEVPVDRDEAAAARMAASAAYHQSWELGADGVWRYKGDASKLERGDEEQAPALPMDVKTDFKLPGFFAGEIMVRAIARQAGNPQAGIDLVIANRKYTETMDGIYADYVNQLSDIQQKTGLKFSDKNVMQKIWGVVEGKKTSSDPKINQAATAIIQMHQAIRDHMADAGVKLKTPSGDFLKYADIEADPNYMPHRIDWNAKLEDPVTKEKYTLKQIMGKTFGEAKRERMIRSIAAASDMTPEAVIDYLNNMRTTPPVMGHIHRARTINFPIYRQDLDTELNYINQVAHAIATEKIFGSDLRKLNELIDRVPSSNGRATIHGLFDSLFRPQDWNTAYGRLYNAMIGYEVATKMTWSALKVPFHLGNAPLALHGDVRPIAKAVWDSIVNRKEFKENTAMAGTIIRQMNPMLLVGDVPERSFVRQLFKKEQFDRAYRWSRAISGASAKVYMEQYAMNDLRKGGTRAEEARRILKERLLIGDKGIDEAIQRGHFTEDQLRTGQRAFTNFTVFSNNSLQMPAWARMDTDKGGNTYGDIAKANLFRAVRMTYLLQSFAVKIHSLVKEAVYDEVVHYHNYKPLLYLMIAEPALGTMLRGVGAAIPSGFHRGLEDVMGKKHETDSWDKFLAKFKALHGDHPIVAFLQLYVDGLAGQTAFDLLRIFSGPLLEAAIGEKQKAREQYGYIKNDVIEQQLGPAWGDLYFNLADAITGEGKAEIARDPKDARIRNFMRWLTQEVPATRIIPGVEDLTKKKQASSSGGVGWGAAPTKKKDSGGAGWQ